MWKLNNTILNSKWVKEEIKKEIEEYFDQMKIETQCTKTYEMLQKNLE